MGIPRYSPKIQAAFPDDTFTEECAPPWPELLKFLRQNLVVEIAGIRPGINFIWLGADFPPAGFNGIWARLTPTNAPMGFYVFHNGNWVLMAGNEIGDVMYKLEKTPQQAPWFKADGNNGTVNLSSLPNYNPAPGIYLHQYVGY